MIFIAHRGLFKGPDEKTENNPTQIRAALEAGFDVEIDVWCIDGKFALGHDKPQYEVPKEYFYNYKMWLHAKNIEALFALAKHPCANVFFHDKDDAVFTSSNLIWTYPKAEIQLTSLSIAVLPEKVGDWKNLDKCYGICSDYVVEYKKDINFKLPANP